MTRKDTGDVHLWGINSWNHVMADPAVVFAAYPFAADRTLVRTKWLVHKDAGRARNTTSRPSRPSGRRPTDALGLGVALRLDVLGEPVATYR